MHFLSLVQGRVGVNSKLDFNFLLKTIQRKRTTAQFSIEKLISAIFIIVYFACFPDTYKHIVFNRG